MYTERKALEEHIMWIREERRKLSDEYWRAIAHLRELDNKLNEGGPSELTEKLAKMVEEQGNTINELKNLVPKVPVEVAVEQFKKLKEEESVTIEEPKIPNVQIESQKDFDDRNRSVKRRTHQDNTAIAHEIASYLKETGIPTRTIDIQNHMEQKGYILNNPTNYVNRAMEINKRIERVSWGFYQYNFNNN